MDPVVDASDVDEVEDRLTPSPLLFPEILSVIFNHFDVRDKCRAAQVCRTWRDVASHSSMWRAMEVELRAGVRLQPSLFDTLLRRGVRRIKATKSVDVRELLLGLPELESLDLRGYKQEFGLALSTSFNVTLPHLTTLKISWCDHITDPTVVTIAANIPNLENLVLRGCTRLTDMAPLCIATGLTRLKRLDFDACRGITDTGIMHLVAARPRQLEFIGLMNCIALTDEALLYLATGVPTLTSIDVGNCDHIRDTGMKYLSRMTNLREVNIFGCREIGDAGLAYLSRSVSLRKLNLRYCFRVTDEGLAQLAEAGSASNISSLSLGLCRHVTDVGLKHLAQLTNLRRLDLCQCFRITDIGLALLAENGESPITHLDIRGCSEIGEWSLLPIAYGLRRLHTLKLDSRHIVSQGMDVVARNLLGLSVLSVGGINCVDEIRAIRAGGVGQRPRGENKDEQSTLEYSGVDRHRALYAKPSLCCGFKHCQPSFNRRRRRRDKFAKERLRHRNARDV